jgi:hypothetical protein
MQCWTMVENSFNLRSRDLYNYCEIFFYNCSAMKPAHVFALRFRDSARIGPQRTQLTTVIVEPVIDSLGSQRRNLEHDPTDSSVCSGLRGVVQVRAAAALFQDGSGLGRGPDSIYIVGRLLEFAWEPETP